MGKIFGIGVVLLVAIQSISADYKSLCMENNATACYKHGLPMVTGDNAKVQDIKEEGMSFMRKACLLEERLACDIIGDNYFKDGNYLAAVPYLEKSCEHGERDACEAMGTIYRDGLDIRQDDIKSRLYYEKACRLKSANACYNVAIIYRGGFGVKKNREKEKAYYKKGCDAGLRAGCKMFIELDNEDRGIKTGIWNKIKSWFY